MSEGAERRQFLRISRQFAVHISLAEAGEENATPGETADLSPGGLRLRLGKPLPVDMRLHLAIRGKGMVLEIDGVTVWSAPCDKPDTWETGIRFVGPSPAEAASLLELLGRKRWSSPGPLPGQ